jgi:hypothetical protein
MLHVFEDKCPMFIETLPALPRSTSRPDDCETRNVEDHIPDALRYVLMAVGTYARPVFYDEDPMFRNGLPSSMIEVRDNRQETSPLPMFGGLFVGDDTFTLPF